MDIDLNIGPRGSQHYYLMTNQGHKIFYEIYRKHLNNQLINFLQEAWEMFSWKVQSWSSSPHENKEMKERERYVGKRTNNWNTILLTSRLHTSLPQTKSIDLIHNTHSTIRIWRQSGTNEVSTKRVFLHFQNPGLRFSPLKDTDTAQVEI